VVRIITDYLRDHELHYETTKGVLKRSITAGVLQRSVLGLMLWNVVYDGLLGLTMPKGLEMIAFMDDVAVVATERAAETAEPPRQPTGWLHGCRRRN